MPRQQTARTRENKARREIQRMNRFKKARERRRSVVFVHPISGRKKPLGSVAIERRIIQEARIRVKREQRQSFAKLKPAEKAAHRTAAPEGSKTKPTRVKTVRPVPWRSKALTNIMPSR